MFDHDQTKFVLPQYTIKQKRCSNSSPQHLCFLAVNNIAWDAMCAKRIMFDIKVQSNGEYNQWMNQHWFFQYNATFYARAIIFYLLLNSNHEKWLNIKNCGANMNKHLFYYAVISWISNRNRCLIEFKKRKRKFSCIYIYRFFCQDVENITRNHHVLQDFLCMHSNIQLSSATQILLSFSHLILSTWREKFLSINYLRRGISKTHGYHFYMKSIVIIINHIILFFFIARSYKGWRWVEIISSLPSISKTFFSFFSVQKNMRARSFLQQ